MDTQQNNKLLVSLIAIALLVIAILITALINTSDHPLVGVGGTDGELGGDFTLTTVKGDVSLSDFAGKVVVMYFGFLSCPEVCPNSMIVMQRTLNKLNENEQDQLQGLLVSIDPKRDSLQDLKDFTEYYHPKIMGMTGTVEQVDLVARNYGAFFEITESETPDSEYAYRHSSRYYIINQQGELVDAMRHSTTPNELAARIKQIIDIDKT